MRVTRQEAISRLTRRWEEECFNYPMMRESLPLSVYIAANIALVERKGLLSGYAS